MENYQSGKIFLEEATRGKYTRYLAISLLNRLNVFPGLIGTFLPAMSTSFIEGHTYGLNDTDRKW